jgi:hypothetical protein
MGWSDCGTDRRGRPIGYGHEATCDEPGCETRIDRGLAYACGGSHGEGELDCDRYFCADHLFYSPAAKAFICRECQALLTNADAEAEG